MSESISAVSAIDEQAATQSLSVYQSWLSDQGHLPVSQVMPKHPGELMGRIADEATSLSQQFRDFKQEMSTFFDPKKLIQPAKDIAAGDQASRVSGMTSLTTDGSPYPTPINRAEGSTAKERELNPLEGSINMLNEAMVNVVEQQVRQMAALVQHNLSMQVLHTSIETSINTGKQVSRGIEQALRG